MTKYEQIPLVSQNINTFKVQNPDGFLLTKQNIDYLKSVFDQHPEFSWPDNDRDITGSEFFAVGNIIFVNNDEVTYTNPIMYDLYATTECKYVKNILFYED